MKKIPKKHAFLLLPLLLCLALITACGSTAKESMNTSASLSDNTASEEKGSYGSTSETLSTTTSVEGERKIIKTFSVEAEIDQFDAAVTALGTKIIEVGGYIESSSVYEHCASYTVRIPAEKAEEFVNTLGTLLHVTASSSSANDVSESYYSTEARLNELITERDSLLQIMESLDTQQDYNFWLTLNQRLSSIRQDIAVYQARLQNYDSKVAYSTVKLTLDEVTVYTPDEETGFGERLGTAFVEGWSDFGTAAMDFAVWFVGAFPFLLIPLLCVAALTAFLIVRRKKAKKKAEPVPEEPKSE